MTVNGINLDNQRIIDRSMAVSHTHALLSEIIPLCFSSEAFSAAKPPSEEETIFFPFKPPGDAGFIAFRVPSSFSSHHGRTDSPCLSTLALPMGIVKSLDCDSSDISKGTPYISSFSRNTTATHTHTHTRL